MKKPLTVFVADDSTDQVSLITRWVLSAAIDHYKHSYPDRRVVAKDFSIKVDNTIVLRVVPQTDPDVVSRFLAEGYADIAFIDYRWPVMDNGIKHVGSFCLSLIDNLPDTTEVFVTSNFAPVSARVDTGHETTQPGEFRAVSFCEKTEAEVASALSAGLKSLEKKGWRHKSKRAFRHLWYGYHLPPPKAVGV